MTTLIAFGDSHTVAGAEIEQRWGQGNKKAYPAKIANHYGMDYENYGQVGGSNYWLMKKFMSRVQMGLEETRRCLWSLVSVNLQEILLVVVEELFMELHTS